MRPWEKMWLKNYFQLKSKSTPPLPGDWRPSMSEQDIAEDIQKQQFKTRIQKCGSRHYDPGERICLIHFSFFLFFKKKSFVVNRLIRFYSYFRKIQFVVNLPIHFYSFYLHFWHFSKFVFIRSTNERNSGTPF